jgi:hypothetical protein
MKPSDAPPPGLGSADADDWQITLERSSGKMVAKGYLMADISLAEANEVRSKSLNESVALLVSRASDAGRASRRRNRRNLALYMSGGALAVIVIGFAMGSRRSRNGGR